MANLILSVAMGGAIGATLRYLLNHWVNQTFIGAFPYGTLSVNVIGSFAMGILFILFSNKLGQHFAFNEHTRLFLMTGLLGSFTTFSTFSLDFIHLIEKQAYLHSLSYLLLSVSLSIAALFLGIFLTRSFS